jgi:hypothetical protein
MSVDPELEAQLPESVRGIRLERISMPLSQVAGGTDVCFLMCPDEPSRLAYASGLRLEKLTYAVAFDPSAELGVVVSAVRFPGIETARLIDIRLAAGAHSGARMPEPTVIMIGSRTLLWVTYGPFHTPYDNEYLYAAGDVLFMISGWPPEDGEAPIDVALAVGQLP